MNNLSPKKGNGKVLLDLIIRTKIQFSFLVCAVTNSRMTLSKVYIKRASDKAATLNSCFVDVFPRHNDIMAGQSFNECANFFR